jgi:hypothetical protein
MNKHFATIIIIFTVFFGMAFQCGRENGGTDSARKTTDSGGLTEEIVKQKITQSVEKSVLGVTGPKSVDVEFESIKFGNAEKPSIRDENDGIRSDIYYPVRVRYTIIRHYSDSDQEEERYEDCKFFKDSFGEWSYRFSRAG